MRVYLRWFFEIALVLLIMGGCTQTISWFGKLTVASDSPRYRGASYPYYNDSRYRQRSSTYATTPENEDDDELEEEEDEYPEYNRHYINGEYR